MSDSNLKIEKAVFFFFFEVPTQSREIKRNEKIKNENEKTMITENLLERIRFSHPVRVHTVNGNIIFELLLKSHGIIDCESVWSANTVFLIVRMFFFLFFFYVPSVLYSTLFSIFSPIVS